MKIQQILQKCLTDWKNISQIDFCLLDSDNHIFLSTCDKKLPAESKLEEFRQSSALCVSNTSCCLYKIMENHSISYILIVWGKAESTATIGELAVCQVQRLLAAYAEKSDKNTFMQNLLLGSYSDVDAFNRAKKLHIQIFYCCDSSKTCDLTVNTVEITGCLKLRFPGRAHQ